MKRTRGDLIRVGVFVTAAGAILVGGLLWIAGSSLLRPVAQYNVRFKESVSGLNASANVEYQGVVVGRVADIRLTADMPPQVDVLITLPPTTPIREDTRAALVGSLVTGIKFIELQGGSESSPPLPPGGTIPGSAASLQEFRDKLAEIGDRALSILKRLDENVFTETTTEEVGEIMKNFGIVSKSLATALQNFQTEQTGQDLTTLVRRVSDLADNVNNVVKDFYARRDAIYGGLESTLADLNRTINDGRRLVVDSTTQVNDAGTSVTQLVNELAGATARLQETIDVIQSNPSTLLWGRVIPEREFDK